MHDVYICVDCRSEWSENDFPDLESASSNWSYSCKMCGGKIVSYAIPEEDDLDAVKDAIRDQMDSERFNTTPDEDEGEDH